MYICIDKCGNLLATYDYNPNGIYPVATDLYVDLQQNLYLYVCGTGKDYYSDGRVFKYGSATVDYYQNGKFYKIGEYTFDYYQNGTLFKIGSAYFDYHSSGRYYKIGNSVFDYYSDGRIYKLGDNYD